jgi:uncharacterized protein YbaR (Trm112 family)
MVQTGTPLTKYPNGYFKDKKCKNCGNVFTPTNPCNVYCSPECKGKNAYYKRNYGIDDATLKQMKEDQNNRCFICDSEGFLIGKNNHTEKLAVDHDHKTGKVRKLLCHNCNRALGLFQDSPELLKKAAKYVEEHSRT